MPLILEDDAEPFRLRGEQPQWVEKIETDFQMYHRLLAVAPGGCGKTTVFAALADRKWRRFGLRSLVLENRDRLTEQTAQRIRQETGLDVDVEKADQHASPFAPIVVGSVQTLSRPNRLTGFAPNHFGMVIADEAHMSLADSWQRVMRYFHYGPESLSEDWKRPEEGTYIPLSKIVGFTASPHLGGRKNLGEFYQHVSVNYSYLRAIQDGWLVGIEEHNIPVRIDTRKFRVKRTADGNAFDSTDQSRAIIPLIGELATQIELLGKDKKGICFLPSVECSRLMADELNRRGIPAIFVSGECLDKNEKTDKFAASGPGTWLINCALYVYGIDFPDVDAIAPFSAVISKASYCLDEKTEILTSDGWKSDISAGEMVAAFDTKTSHIRYVPALDVIRRPMNDGERFLSIKTKSADIRVTENHRMIYDNKRQSGWKIKEAREIEELKQPVYFPACGQVAMQGGVPLTDDELRFIGWVMTDGTINRITKQIAITQGEHQPWLEEIERCIVGCGFKFTRTAKERKSQFNSSSRIVMWTISFGGPKGRDKHLTGWERLESWISKEIAEPLMRVNEPQFDVLLSAINLGDGSKFKSRKYKGSTFLITSGNKKFCDRLQILGIGFGYRVCIFTNSGWKGNPIYVITLSKRKFVCIGGKIGDRQEWKYQQPEPGERCWCVENEVGTIVTRRNGRVVIMGNCQKVYRGTRVLPGLVTDEMGAELRREVIAASKKPKLILISPFFISDRIDICSVYDLFSDNPTVKKKMQESGLPLEEAAEKATRDYLKSLEKEAKKHAAKQARVIDPVRWSVSLGDASLASYVPKEPWEREPITAEQVKLLQALNMDPDKYGIRTKGLAQRITGILLLRKDEKLATPGQLEFLKKLTKKGPDGHPLMDEHGKPVPMFSDERLATMKADQAGAITGRMVAQWKARA